MNCQKLFYELCFPLHYVNSVKLREEISGKGQQHYAGDKLALLEVSI